MMLKTSCATTWPRCKRSSVRSRLELLNAPHLRSAQDAQAFALTASDCANISCASLSAMIVLPGSLRAFEGARPR